MTTNEPAGMPIDKVRELRPGTIIEILEKTMGDSADGEERTYPAGTLGEVASIGTLPGPQGLAVTVVIGPQSGEEAIVNVFDEGDPCFPFALPSDE